MEGVAVERVAAMRLAKHQAVARARVPVALERAMDKAARATAAWARDAAMAMAGMVGVEPRFTLPRFSAATQSGSIRARFP